MNINNATYEFELYKVCSIINRHKYKNVGIQLPEGLKIYATEIMEYIKNNTGAIPILSSEPVYGGCDVDFNTDIDFLVHFGHTKFIEPKYKNIFVECRSNIDIKNIVTKSIQYLDKNVGIVTTVQHIHKINEIKSILADENINVFIGKGTKRIIYPGQVLGCNFSSAISIKDKIDEYLYIGSGYFHPIGVSLATNKNVIVADIYKNKVITDIETQKEKILRQRYTAIELSMNARSIGIIISTKKGQKRMNTAKKLKNIAERKNRKTYFIVGNEIKPEYLPIDINVFVCTACPRIPIDDYLLYKKPILTPIEFLISIGEMKFENYVFEQIV